MQTKALVLALGVGLAACQACQACQGGAPKKPTLQTQKDKVSYSIGLDLGKNLKAQAIDIDARLVAQGIEDALAGGATLLTDEQVRETMTLFQQERMAQQGARAKGLADKNQNEGAAFLASNAKKEGVVTLPSGLQYKIVTPGAGKKPKASDTVTTQYRGTLIDGTEFDSSYRNGQPVSFPVTGVIAGWTEALQLMPVGSKWRLFIPPGLAYGPRGAGNQIGPNATLVFEIELLGIK